MPTKVSTDFFFLQEIISKMFLNDIFFGLNVALLGNEQILKEADSWETQITFLS